MVGHAFELGHDGAEMDGAGGRGEAEGGFGGMGEGEAVGDGGVARDAGGEAGGKAGGFSAHEGERAFVGVAEPGFEFQDRLATEGEAEIAGLDDRGVDRADGDLVHALAGGWGVFGPGGGAVRRAEMLDGGARVGGAGGGVAARVVREALEPGGTWGFERGVGVVDERRGDEGAGLVEGVGVWWRPSRGR